MPDFESVTVKNEKFFGLDYAPADAEIVLLSAPWDVTTSYRDGASRGPRAVLEASYQLDLFSPYRPRASETKIATLPAPPLWFERNRELRTKAKRIIDSLEKGISPQDRELTALLSVVNDVSREFHLTLEQEAARWIQAGKRVVTLGGDHSVTLGPLRALAALGQPVSVLHIDAHADLRMAYEGFEHSHASIMHHVSRLAFVEQLVQVGIRDLSESEREEIELSPKITTHFDWDLRRKTAGGATWHSLSQEILAKLGKNVYLSVDVDGFDPKLCPHTGTPVPGGLELHEFYQLLEQLQASGRRLIGADLVEVAPGPAGDEWDANVGARLLYQICQFVRNGMD